MIIRTAQELGHLARDYRQRRGLTQADLASQVGVSRKWIIDLESGKRTTDLSLVLRTLNTLGIELNATDRSANREADKGVDLNAIIDSATRGWKR